MRPMVSPAAPHVRRRSAPSEAACGLTTSSERYMAAVARSVPDREAGALQATPSRQATKPAGERGREPAPEATRRQAAGVRGAQAGAGSVRADAGSVYSG